MYLLQDFSIIRGKLEAQRLFATPRTAEQQTKVEGQSQGSLETVTTRPSSTRAKPRPRSASIGGGVQRSSPLTSSQSCRPTPRASNLLEVADASLAEAMNKVPLAYELQKKPDFKHINTVYKKFWSECKSAYVFGIDEKKDSSIQRLVAAPTQYNICSKEKKLVDTMVVYLLNLPDRKLRQTLCIMPKDRISKPTSWEEIKNGQFYIINKQHSVAASKKITKVESRIDDDVKRDFRIWSCFIVWSNESEILRSISAYNNRINDFQMIQPSWATNILGARTVWVNMGSLENPTQITVVGTTAARRASNM